MLKAARNLYAMMGKLWWGLVAVIGLYWCLLVSRGRLGANEPGWTIVARGAFHGLILALVFDYFYWPWEVVDALDWLYWFFVVEPLGYLGIDSEWLYIKDWFEGVRERSLWRKWTRFALSIGIVITVSYACMVAYCMKLRRDQYGDNPPPYY